MNFKYSNRYPIGVYKRFLCKYFFFKKFDIVSNELRRKKFVHFSIERVGKSWSPLLLANVIVVVAIFKWYCIYESPRLTWKEILRWKEAADQTASILCPWLSFFLWVSLLEYYYIFKVSDGLLPRPTKPSRTKQSLPLKHGDRFKGYGDWSHKLFWHKASWKVRDRGSESCFNEGGRLLLLLFLSSHCPFL